MAVVINAQAMQYEAAALPSETSIGAIPTDDTTGLKKSLLLMLDEWESLFWRMNAGVARFFTFSFLRWLLETARDAGHIAIKASRVFVVALLWTVVCFGPLALLWLRPSWISRGWLFLLVMCWVSCAIIGSIRGLKYVRRRAADKA